MLLFSRCPNIKRQETIIIKPIIKRNIIFLSIVAIVAAVLSWLMFGSWEYLAFTVLLFLGIAIISMLVGSLLVYIIEKFKEMRIKANNRQE